MTSRAVTPNPLRRLTELGQSVWLDSGLILDDLAVAGIDLERLTDRLVQDGIAQFVRSRDVLEARISALQRQTKAA